MDENWIEFEDSESRPRDKMYVSMSKIGEILLNRIAFEALEQPEAVVLLYDPDNDKIGLRPASIRMPNAFRFKTKGLCSNRLVRAKPFITKHDIRFDGTVRFRGPEIKNGVLVLSLRDVAKVPKPIKKAARR